MKQECILIFENNPFLAFAGELWVVYGEYFLENCYIETKIYCQFLLGLEYYEM